MDSNNKKKQKLTPKQVNFCNEYLIDLNATEAIIRAGYKVKSKQNAAEMGTELLKKEHIAEYLAQRRRDQEKRTEITADRVLKELALVAFSDFTDYTKVIEKEQTAPGKKSRKYKIVDPVPTDKLTEDQRKAIAYIKKGRDGFEIRLHDKMKALELLGKHLGLFDDQEEKKARIALLKANVKRAEASLETTEEETVDDGFLAALSSTAADDWSDYDA